MDELVLKRERVALLDTSIQIDRRKSRTRHDRIEDFLKHFDWKVSTGISLLEFKATIIQQCITIHNQLRRRGRFTTVQDALTEKDHPQAKLRGHIFTNIIQVFGSSFDITEEQDRRLAEKARLKLESDIPALYRWFVKESADAILREPINCTRAAEPPQKKKVAFTVNLPICRRGKNKFCNVEEFIRQGAPTLIEPLRGRSGESNQLQSACGVFEAVLHDPTIDLSHSDCRRAGDALIALEAAQHATHVLSTNARDWKPLSEIIGFEFVRVDYPEEKTL